MTRTASYNGLQLQSDTSTINPGGPSPITKKYLYDSQGNLACIVLNAYNGTSCPGIASGDPNLVTYNIFDTKNRLAGTRTYGNGQGGPTVTDSADYYVDALDRTVSETETHTSQTPATTRTDANYIGLSGAVGQEQLFDAGGNPTGETKTYVYDATGRRTTLADIGGRDQGRYSYVYDSRGSVEALVDQSRVVRASYGYTAYGGSNPLTYTVAGFNPSTNLYRYDGQRFDTGSNTIDFGARRFSPGTERWS